MSSFIALYESLILKDLSVFKYILLITGEVSGI